MVLRVGASILRKMYGRRDPWCHKYDFGSLLVIGGSRKYSGSPALNSLAALRSGVDLVTIAAPERAANIAASFSPNIIAYPLDGDFLSPKHMKELMELTKNKSAVVIGGGLTDRKETSEAVVKYLQRITIPAVIDADAIRAISGRKDMMKDRNFILTPNAREFEALSCLKPSNSLNERIKMVKDVASIPNVTILLKGHIDVISDGTLLAVNSTGSPFMTKGGMGDTLAGICGALLARGNGQFSSACASAYINGKAGSIAAKRLGESTTATDLIDSIPAAIKS
jgi:hydroxyethylthiazole kinase-like uncharacterized protein yjeF